MKYQYFFYHLCALYVKNQRLTSNWLICWSFCLIPRRCTVSSADWLDYWIRKLLDRSSGCLSAVIDGIISAKLRHTNCNSYVINLGRSIKLFCQYVFSSLGTPDNPFAEIWGSAKPSLRNIAFNALVHTFPLCLSQSSRVCVCVCVCVWKMMPL